jgi:DNA-binding NtrC family response regulator
LPRGRRLSPGSLLEQGQTPVIIVDDDEQISLVSLGMQQLTGWTAEDLIELQCRRSAPAGKAAIDVVSCVLAPPAECWSGQILTEPAVIPHRDGRILRIRLTFVPLRHADGTVPSVMIIGEPSEAVSAGRTTPTVTQSLHAEINALRLDLRKRFGTDSFLGHCDPLRKALQQAELLSRADCAFSITGPEGSGRRHLVRLIHGTSRVADSSLAVLNCHLLTVSALLATLKQLQTVSQPASGAPHLRIGMLLLLGIERMPREAQESLLRNRALTESQIRLAATSESAPGELARQGHLLPELARLLTIVEITLPPLHDRGNDVLLLSEHFLQENRRDRSTTPERLAPDVRDAFLNYRWPGNVRELRTVIDAASLKSRTSDLRADDLPLEFRVGQNAQRYPIPRRSDVISLESVMQQLEREIIETTLHEVRGNKAEAARRLNLTRPRLYRRMKLLGMDVDD